MQRCLKILFNIFTPLLLILLTASSLSAQSDFEGKRVLIVLKEKNLLQQILSIIESDGGHVVHIFPPRLLHAYITKEANTALHHSGLIDFIAEEPLKSGTLEEMSLAETMGMSTWNNLFVTTVKLQEDAIGKDQDEIPAIAPQTILYHVPIEQNKTQVRTSEYLIGSVSVGIIFVESNGALDIKTERWTPADKEDIAEQIYSGLDWWSHMGGYRANVSWTYDVKECKTRYEPISRTKDESVLWVKECMAQLGYPHGEDYMRARTYANDLREKYNTDWAFVIFVVPDRNDADGYFANKSGIAWAYVGGPYLVVPNKCNGWGYHNVWKIVAHETGHIFRALDEYEPTGALDADAVSNVTSLQKAVTQTNTICLMKSNDLFLCDHTRKQIGWSDENYDGIYDLDHRHSNTLTHLEKMIKETARATSPKLVFYENFSGQNEWFEDRNNRIANGVYWMYDSAYGSSSWLDRDYYDFTASVRTQWIQGSAASGYGLMVRVKTATDGYIFFINKHRQFAFGKYVNANWKYLEPWRYSEVIKSDGENILTAKCLGNRFTLYINDQQVADLTDDTFIYGNVGLAVLPEVQIAFDDLTILQP